MPKAFDLLVFGATGVTGRYVVEKLAETLHKRQLPIRWAIAVRNPEKMKTQLRQMEATVGVTDLASKIPVMRADVNDVTSMKKAFGSAKLVLNCIGPYSLLGEPVVKACVNSKSHYMDLSGEPLFLESMQLKYDSEAQRNQVYVVGSCGFDSIPSDIGTQYLKEKFDGHLGHVEHTLEVWYNAANKYSIASWVSLIEGIKHADKLKPIREQLFSPFGHLYSPYDYRVPLKRRPVGKDARGYLIPFPGSDRSVVKRTQLYRHRILNEPPVQFEAYLAVPSLKQLLLTALMHRNVKLLSKWPWSERLLYEYAHIFSLGLFAKDAVPNHATLLDDRFQITFVGKGWPRGIGDTDKRADNMTKKSAVLIRGGNLAYIDTATIAVHTALTLLKAFPQSRIPFGVVTPASIIEPKQIIPSLVKDGVLFDFIEDYTQ